MGFEKHDGCSSQYQISPGGNSIKQLGLQREQRNTTLILSEKLSDTFFGTTIKVARGGSLIRGTKALDAQAG
jgi:hypothetical protein